MTPLTHETFLEFTQLHDRAIVHFWAEWNGNDRIMTEMIETELSRRLAGRVVFGSLNTDPPQHHIFCVEIGLIQLPTLALYRDGNLAGTILGLHDVTILESRIVELIGMH